MDKERLDILLCDDHELIINGLQQFISSFDFVKSIKSATNGKEAIELLKTNNFDIVISDISMPEMDGIELSQFIKENYKNIKIVIITQHTDIQFIKPLLQIDVDGIILKGSKSEELKKSLLKVINGEKGYSDTIFNVITECLIGKNTSNSITIKLSNREKQVLELIADEHTNKEISEKLFISVPTVETYRSNLFRKFEVKNSVGLIRKAIQLGFIK
jgi:DNA-binding NarL/FixJ family response regulator